MAEQPRDEDGRFMSPDAGVIPRLTARVSRRIETLPVAINPANFLTAEDDATVGGVSVLSRPQEWHAAAIGYLVMTTVLFAHALGVEFGAVLSALGGGSFVLGRMWGRFTESAQFGDALREPAYAALGSLVAVVPAVAYLLV